MVKKYKGRLTAVAVMLIMLLTISWETPYLPALFGVCAMLLYGLGNRLDTLTHREREWRERAFRLETLINGVDASFCSWNPSSNTVHVSKGFEKIYGLTQREFLQRPDLWREVIHPDDLPVALRMEADFLQGKRSQSEYRIIRPDGQVRWIQDRGVPQLDPHGKLLRVNGMVIDITERKLAEQTLAAREQQLRTLIDAMPDYVCFKDVEGRWMEVNRFGLQLFELENVPYQGKKNSELAQYSPFYRDVLHKCEELDQQVWKVGGTIRCEEVIPQREGMDKVFDVTRVPLFEAGKRPMGMVIIGRDITERKKAEAQVNNILNSLDVAVWSVDGHTEKLNYRSAGTEKITGYPAQMYFEQPDLWKTIIHPDDRAMVEEAVGQLCNGQVLDVEYRIIHASGEVRWVRERTVPILQMNGAIQRYDGITIDITERKRSELKITHMAYHDVLTDLPNRRLFHDRLQRELSTAEENGTSVAVMFIDLDNFKRINDTLGHVVGDMLLQEVVQVLTRALRPDDLIARLGGDEFAILLRTISREEAARLAENIITALSRPLYVQQHELFITTSIGISVFPDDGTDMDTLLRFADAAMYNAKEKGKNNFQFYSATNHHNIHRELEMEKHLRRALELDEFHLRYQPQLDLQTGRVIGLEALLRWRNPVLGDVSPSEFIPLAEASGLIVPIGEWVLQTACADLKKWQDAGLPPVHVSVNLSSRQFHRQDLCTIIADVLSETGLHPQYLDLEITESMTMEVDAALSILTRLKQLGVQVSIDDFGTGYSSLSYLKSFPIDRIKIDQSFIREIKSDPKQAAIVSTIISMTKNLQLKAIAEGVETPEQLAYLEQLGCDEVQGFFFARPLPSEEIPAWLESAVGRA